MIKHILATLIGGVLLFLIAFGTLWTCEAVDNGFPLGWIVTVVFYILVAWLVGYGIMMLWETRKEDR